MLHRNSHIVNLEAKASSAGMTITPPSVPSTLPNSSAASNRRYNGFVMVPNYFEFNEMQPREICPCAAAAAFGRWDQRCGQRSLTATKRGKNARFGVGTTMRYVARTKRAGTKRRLKRWAGFVKSGDRTCLSQAASLGGF